MRKKILLGCVGLVFFLNGVQASEDPRVVKGLGGPGEAARCKRTQLMKDLKGATDSGFDTLNSFLNPADTTKQRHINGRLKLEELQSELQ